MRNRTTYTSFAFLAVLAIGLGAWGMTYPGNDPRGLKYVLWKHGLYRMNLDEACDTMIGDARRDAVVLGRTKAELRDRFGYLLTPVQTSKYNRTCYENSSSSEDALFIRNSSWMVVFDGPRATKLILIKGC